MENKPKNKWRTALVVIVILYILSLIVSGFFSFIEETDFKEGNVALIPIEGVIMAEKGGTFDSGTASSATIVKFIEDADKNPQVKAIIFEINSPGGSPVATEEIVNAIKRTNKTTVAWIREIGTSGAYWVASSADTIVASRMSLTGSIGVLASFLQFSGLLQRYNVTYERLNAGAYKDIGSPLKPLTLDERKMLQEQIDSLHEYFINSVAENRNLSKVKVKELATGMFYLGEQAKDMGLIDVIGGKEEAKQIIEKKLNITAEIVEYREEVTLMDILSRVMSQQSFFVGKGIGSSLVERAESNEIKIWT